MIKVDEKTSPKALNAIKGLKMFSGDVVRDAIQTPIKPQSDDFYVAVRNDLEKFKEYKDEYTLMGSWHELWDWYKNRLVYGVIEDGCICTRSESRPVAIIRSECKFIDLVVVQTKHNYYQAALYRRPSGAMVALVREETKVRKYDPLRALNKEELQILSGFKDFINKLCAEREWYYRFWHVANFDKDQNAIVGHFFKEQGRHLSFKIQLGEIPVATFYNQDLDRFNKSVTINRQFTFAGGQWNLGGQAQLLKRWFELGGEKHRWGIKNKKPGQKEMIATCKDGIYSYFFMDAETIYGPIKDHPAGGVTRERYYFSASGGEAYKRTEYVTLYPNKYREVEKGEYEYIGRLGTMHERA